MFLERGSGCCRKIRRIIPATSWRRRPIAAGAATIPSNWKSTWQKSLPGLGRRGKADARNHRCTPPRVPYRRTPDLHHRTIHGRRWHVEHHRSSTAVVRCGGALLWKHHHRRRCRGNRHVLMEFSRRFGSDRSGFNLARSNRGTAKSRRASAQHRNTPASITMSGSGLIPSQKW